MEMETMRTTLYDAGFTPTHKRKPELPNPRQIIVSPQLTGHWRG